MIHVECLIKKFTLVMLAHQLLKVCYVDRL